MHGSVLNQGKRKGDLSDARGEITAVKPKNPQVKLVGVSTLVILDVVSE